MAKADILSFSNQSIRKDGLYDDIWSQKARIRMTTARERKSLTLTSMSAEAAMAMQQLSSPTSNSKQLSTKGKRSIRKTTSKRSNSDSSERVQTAEHVCTVKLSDVYEKLGAEQKLEGDITDPSTWEERENQTKFVLGGGKMGNAMEIVEIVNADDPKPERVEESSDLDEQAIAEIARINSINKCNVWFEAHGALLDSDTSATEPGDSSKECQQEGPS